MSDPGRTALALVVGSLIALVGCGGPGSGAAASGEEGTSAPGAATGSQADPGSVLEKRNDALLAHVQAGDAATAAGYYTPEALLLPPDGSVIRGRDAIRDYWAAGSGFDSVATERVSVAAADRMASHTARYTIWSTAADETVQATRGVFLIVWVRGGDGTWRIQADMWN